MVAWRKCAKHQLRFYEHFFRIFLNKGRKSRDYNPLQTVRCFPLRVYNTDQSKESVRTHINSLETSDELVEIIEMKRMNFFEQSQ